MNAMTLFLLLCTATALTALTWWGCAWWYGRKLSDLHGKLEKTRQTAAQSATATRRQISQLQKELAERSPLNKTQRAARDEAAEQAAEKAARKQALLDDDSFDKTIRLPAHGFADTQPMM
ncbi:MAG TPA: hypothetical protein VLI72_07205 [Methylibium sp.]|nr:hypothetical protein [Methylibium sp.]